MPHRKDTYIKEFRVTKKFLITEIQRDGLPAIAIRARKSERKRKSDRYAWGGLFGFFNGRKIRRL